MHMRFKIAVYLMGLILICTGCAPISYHRIEKESLIEQIHKSGEKIPDYAPDGYSLAHMRKIRCFNKENEPVYISSISTQGWICIQNQMARLTCCSLLYHLLTGYFTGFGAGC